MALPPSLHDQYRTLRELHDAVGAAADHALVQCRMACRPDDEEIDLELGRVSDDGAHRTLNLGCVLIKATIGCSLTQPLFGGGLIKAGIGASPNHLIQSV